MDARTVPILRLFLLFSLGLFPVAVGAVGLAGCSHPSPPSGTTTGSAGAASSPTNSGVSGSGQPDNGSGTGGAASGEGASGTAGSTEPGGGAGGGAAGTGGSPATSGNGGAGASDQPSGGGAGDNGVGGMSGGGPNLIANGDFSQGSTNWHFEQGTAAVDSGHYCTSAITGSGMNPPLFGWQNDGTPLSLAGGQRYTLTYRASGSAGAALHAKVSHAMTPWTPIDYDAAADDQLSSTLQTFTHSFTPSSADDNAGMVFIVKSGQDICIADVTLTAN